MRADPPPLDFAPLLSMRWEDLVYLHWDVDPDEVAGLLPAGLEPDVVAGRAWVGLVPFRMASIRVVAPGGRRLALPWSTFPETNVRTYVRGPDGGRGVLFHSLDVPRAAPTFVARVGFRLPYCHSSMLLERRGDRLGAVAHRRWPRLTGGSRPSSRLLVDVGREVPTGELDELDVALSARWALYTQAPGGAILKADVRHPAWTLHEASVHALEDGLVEAAGYRLQGRPPVHVRAAAPVDVLVSRPRRVTAGR